MKWKMISVLAAATGLMLLAAATSSSLAVGASQNQSPPTNEDVSSTPSVFVPAASYRFAPVAEGTRVTHDFVIRNRGTGLLKIEKVRTG